MKNPAFFRGSKKTKSYFEGWYFKCISKDRKHAVALIPGMAIDPEGRKHSFIQVIHAITGKTYYFDFPYNKFNASENEFKVQIDSNAFGERGLSVNINQPEKGAIHGNLSFSDIRTYPTSTLHPGIMGPFSFIPNMECNHVIIHMSHSISGQLILDDEVLDFEDGIGYIEKDYGRSFPQYYVWIQAGHFNEGEASLVFSRARIPFAGREFPGFFAYFTDFKNIHARFATYNRSKLVKWAVDSDSGTCSAKLTGPAGTLCFDAKIFGGGTLRAPINGRMDRQIVESISAEVQITLRDKKDNIIYSGTSREVGMEICM